MPVISLDLIGLKDGEVFYPSAEAVAEMQKTISSNMLEVLSSNFPNQLGFVNHPDASGVNQYDIAKQAVHDAFPGYIVVAADQAAYPTYVYGTETDTRNGITAIADIRIVELALDETIQDKMVASLDASVTASLGKAYPDMPINVNTTMLTGNVEITLPEDKITGVISAATRETTDVSFHEVLFQQILAKTDVAGPGGKPLDLYLVDQLDNIDGLRGGAGNDTLKGLGGDDLLKGGAGNDRIFGDSGNDVIFGGNGADKLTGGAGADAFVFDSVDTNARPGDKDIITDFNARAGDKIDLSLFDANLNMNGDQAFRFIGNRSFDKNATGEVRFDEKTHVLQISTDADSAPELSILLSGVNKVAPVDLIL